MHFLYFLLIGLAAGWLTGRITQGSGFGLIGNLVVGVMGSFVGGFLFGLLGLSASGVAGSLIMAVIGAIVFLMLLRFLKGHGGGKKQKE